VKDRHHVNDSSFLSHSVGDYCESAPKGFLPATREHCDAKGINILVVMRGSSDMIPGISLVKYIHRESLRHG
jgi:hypothetical protein